MFVHIQVSTTFDFGPLCFSKWRVRWRMEHDCKYTTSSEAELELALKLIDPILQFLLKASKKIDVTLKSLFNICPLQHRHLLHLIPDLMHRNVLRWEVCNKEELESLTFLQASPFTQREVYDDAFFHQRLNQLIESCTNTKAFVENDLEVIVGFPYKYNDDSKTDKGDGKKQVTGGSLHGSTKAAAKKRLMALQKSIPVLKDKAARVEDPSTEIGKDNQVMDETQEALDELSRVLSHSIIKLEMKDASEQERQFDLSQAAYAGCKTERTAHHLDLSPEARSRIPICLMNLLNLAPSPDNSTPGPSLQGENRYNVLYSHQALAINAIFLGKHTFISTGTGSGKSKCFLIPILSDVIRGDIERLERSNAGCTALLVFPTKALAQDQLSKMTALLTANTDVAKHCRVAIIDGDTAHDHRESIAKESNIILTNPDTLHAHILPNWKRYYKEFLARVRYVAIDELHLYSGTFGSHVRMVLSRLVRLCSCSYLSVDEFTNGTGKSWTNPIFIGCSATVSYPEDHFKFICPVDYLNSSDSICILDSKTDGSPCSKKFFYIWNPPMIQENDRSFRRHAADETAILLARLVSKKTRCIAFCATRRIAEWVYEEATQLLATVNKPFLEIYRGGYSTDVRRRIEQRLFNGDIIAVVATSALEVGVDIGGIDVILHCGYPGSYNSLTQQAGRGGRDKSSTKKPSLSITICFDSPAEQHLWNHPKSLLADSKLRPSSSLMNASLVQGHLLCAAVESPLKSGEAMIGTEMIYRDALEKLLAKGSLLMSSLSMYEKSSFVIYQAHPSQKDAWKQVSLRSIEPMNYYIVDLYHPLQGGNDDCIHHKNAILDTIPYSRVFYHAYPGAVITHRGARFRIVSMTPPHEVQGGISRNAHRELIAFAQKEKAKYSTAALSVTSLTVVKYLGRLEYSHIDATAPSTVDGYHPIVLAGHGVVNVKKQVHGYKKLSLVDRSELSRHEIKLPPMEYDTNALWIELDDLRNEIKYFDEGVHALSHALISLAPVFVNCSYSDIDCDHTHFGCTKILLYDTRAGGSETTSRLWDHLFVSNGLIESAIDLLSACPSLCDRSGHCYGCPACIQAVPCSDFQNGLSKPAARKIAEHILHRYRNGSCNYSALTNTENLIHESTISPRRKKRLIALHDASDLDRARGRSILIGRKSWPTDE